jgi:sec-independent protein translocase protein TatB
MFDIGWPELFLVALVTIVVVGPKELPRVLRMVTAGIRKLKIMASDFQNSIDEMARDSDLDEIKRDLEKASEFDLEAEFEDTIDPTGEVTDSVRELETAVSEDLEDDPLALEAADDEAPAAATATETATETAEVKETAEPEPDKRQASS